MHQPTAWKDFQAPLDSLDPLALLDLRASLAFPFNPASSTLRGLSGPKVLLKAQPLVSLDCLEPLAPEESRVTQDSKASEVHTGSFLTIFLQLFNSVFLEGA